MMKIYGDFDSFIFIMLSFFFCFWSSLLFMELIHDVVGVDYVNPSSSCNTIYAPGFMIRDVNLWYNILYILRDYTFLDLIQIMR